jgi:coenzyme F420-0:L-glutamate ligase/coenzyme F420-1:gamma-L-glutamate ligase
VNQPAGLQILPVTGIGEVAPGTDLATVIAAAAPWLRDGDVLVVTSKIVSKAEGRLVEVPAAGGPDRDRARADAVAAETARVVATRGPTRIVATHHGFVMASAGVDASNVDSSQLVLLPKDPDASARALCTALARRHRLRVAVVISDTMGRPWRNGLTDVALGAAGIAPLRDHRGETDPYGNQLELTQMAVVDELAGAAELVKGKTDGVPVAVVRGLLPTAGPAATDSAARGPAATEPADAGPVDLSGVDGAGVAAALVREASQDMFSLGTAEARLAGLRAAATLPEVVAGTVAVDPAAVDPAAVDPAAVDPAAVDPAAVRRALATVAGLVAPGTALRHHPGPPPLIHCAAPDRADPAGLVRFGSDLHRLRAALAAEEIASAIRSTTDPSAAHLLLTADGQP